MAAGRRRWAAREFRLDHAVARERMDPRDQGGYEYLAERKQAAAWREMPWIPPRAVGECGFAGHVAL
eukprot:3636218-Prymnesium_polylepis.1